MNGLALSAVIICDGVKLELFGNLNWSLSLGLLVWILTGPPSDSRLPYRHSLTNTTQHTPTGLVWTGCLTHLNAVWMNEWMDSWWMYLSHFVFWMSTCALYLEFIVFILFLSFFCCCCCCSSSFTMSNLSCNTKVCGTTKINHFPEGLLCWM